MRLREWLNQDIVPARSRLSELYPGKVWHYVLAVIAGVSVSCAVIVAAICYS